MKVLIQCIIERILFRRCKKCIYCSGIFCMRDDKKGEKCRNDIFPYGFMRKKLY